MAEPFLGEIRPFAFGRVPNGWMPCDGQILNVREYEALYSLLGDRYGGDGKRTFALPDLRGRTPLGMGRFEKEDRSRLTYGLGQSGGAENHSLPSDKAPRHSHGIAIQTGIADIGTPKNTFLANAREPTGVASLPTYALPGPLVALHEGSVSREGGGQPLSIRQPFAVLMFCIAVKGDYPPKAG